MTTGSLFSPPLPALLRSRAAWLPTAPYSALHAMFPASTNRPKRWRSNDILHYFGNLDNNISRRDYFPEAFIFNSAEYIIMYLYYPLRKQRFFNGKIFRFIILLIFLSCFAFFLQNKNIRILWFLFPPLLPPTYITILLRLRRLWSGSGQQSDITDTVTQPTNLRWENAPEEEKGYFFGDRIIDIKKPNLNNVIF